AVHIAETKGKGSIAAFLSNILRAEGYGFVLMLIFSSSFSDNVSKVGFIFLSSPHIQTIRERITLGRFGELVSAKTLNSIEHENGRISHFELVLGGPFLPHIECILRDKTLSVSSHVVSASDAGNQSTLNGISRINGRPYQSCDLVMQIERDIKLSGTYASFNYWPFELLKNL
ncbi:dihydrofolate synthetase, partial [Quercus suber]